VSLADNSGFTLGDLLDSEELGLRLVAGGAGSRRRKLRGVHCGDLPHPAALVGGDGLLLTAGAQLGVSAARDAEFLAEIAEAGAAGMGLALGVVHPDVPASLLAPAEELGFPVFTVPPRTPLRDVASLVQRAASSPDVRASRRLLAIQRSLMDALKDDMPREKVLRKLASLSGARVAMISARGEVVFQTAPLPGVVISQCLETTAGIRYLDLPRLHGFAVPVAEAGASGRDWLVLAWPADREIPALAEAAAGQIAVPLLSAISRLSRAEAAVAREVRRAALLALIEPDGQDDPRILSARCRAYGLHLTDGVRVIALCPEGHSPGASALVEQCEGALERAHVPFLAAEQGGTAVILLPASVTDRFIAQSLLPPEPKLRAGVGRAVADGPGIVTSWADAKLAVETRGPQAAITRVIRYDDLDLGTVLLNEISVDRLRPKIDGLLRPLSDNPQMRETLAAYLRHDQDVGRTARALQLHPNSVRYRLARAEEILGVSIRASTTIVALHLALVHGELASGMEETPAVVAKLAEIHSSEWATAAIPA
jgi:DNA-binding PucR family transcriptional regulator